MTEMNVLDDFKCSPSGDGVDRIMASKSLIQLVGSKKSGAKTSKLEKTFQVRSLEHAFVHYCQLKFPEPDSPVEFRRSRGSFLSMPIEFMRNDTFEQTDADDRIFPDGNLIPEWKPASASDKRRTASLPAHLARMCEADLLTPDEEKSYFLRMNYVRFRAEQVRVKLELDSPCLWSIRRVDALLATANWYRDRIVQSNMRLVVSIVKKFVNKHCNFDELLSEGIMALLKSVEKFDIGLGFRFSTYATQVVRRSVYRKVMEMQEERQRTMSNIDDPSLEICDEFRTSSMTEQRWYDLRNKLTTLLDRLDRREKLIIRARFSLGGHRKIQTLQRLADALGVSKERVRQLEKRALDKLHDMADEMETAGSH